MTTYKITPNYSLGMGVILTIETVGTTYKIPCHNRATAEDLKRRALRGDWDAVKIAMTWAS
tara:strand:- start:1152 stop:1334 length:183 start_codon:yes stop_codon:yes gene_type:complete